MSHEIISFVSWAGTVSFPFPVFYTYTYPEPRELTAWPFAPKQPFGCSAEGE